MRHALARLAPFAVAIVLAAGCASATPSVSMPAPSCGGIDIAIDGALPCERIVSIALGALRARAPEHLARGVTSIDVTLGQCPTGEVPPQIDCGTETFAQMVTVEFGPAPAGGVAEPSLTVAVGPATGRVLGISNPLIR